MVFQVGPLRDWEHASPLGPETSRFGLSCPNPFSRCASRFPKPVSGTQRWKPWYRAPEADGSRGTQPVPEDQGSSPAAAIQPAAAGTQLLPAQPHSTLLCDPLKCSCGLLSPWPLEVNPSPIPSWAPVFVPPVLCFLEQSGLSATLKCAGSSPPSLPPS